MKKKKPLDGFVPSSLAFPKDEKARDQFFLAAKNGKIPKMEELLATPGLHVNLRDPDMRATALHRASGQGHCEAVRWLLQQGAQVNAANKNGMPPLHLACQKGNSEVARLLLEAGADLELTTKESRVTALHKACEKGNTKLVKILLSYRANLAARDRNGWTPLHTAADQGHAKLVPLLIESGADPLATTNLGETPLFVAVAAGRTDVVTVLLQKVPGSLLVTDTAGVSPVSAAVRKRQVKLLRELLSKHKESKSLFQANRGEWTPLHYACQGGHSEILRILLEHSSVDAAILDAKTLDGNTALHVAAANGRSCLIPMLVKQQCNVTAKNGLGLTAEDVATAAGHEDITQLLKTVT